MLAGWQVAITGAFCTTGIQTNLYANIRKMQAKIWNISQLSFLNWLTGQCSETWNVANLYFQLLISILNEMFSKNWRWCCEMSPLNQSWYFWQFWCCRPCFNVKSFANVARNDIRTEDFDVAGWILMLFDVLTVFLMLPSPRLGSRGLACRCRYVLCGEKHLPCWYPLFDWLQVRK